MKKKKKKRVRDLVMSNHVSADQSGKGDRSGATCPSPRQIVSTIRPNDQQASVQRDESLTLSNRSPSQFVFSLLSVDP